MCTHLTNALESCLAHGWVMSTKEPYISGKEPYIFENVLCMFNKGALYVYTSNNCSRVMSRAWMSHVYKRALYFRKRALYFRKRALYLYKRALCVCTSDEGSWVMSRIWLSHVSHRNNSCLIYEWYIMCVQIWQMHPYLHKKAPNLCKKAPYLCKRALYLCKRALCIHTLESCLIYESVMPHVGMTNISRMNDILYDYMITHLTDAHGVHMNRK